MNYSNQEIFSADGLLAQQLDDYSFRAEQLQMAETVQETLEFGGSAIIEAGTGVGKTLAYLLPAINSGLRVVVSTGTRNLQDQIYFVDLPLAMRVLGVPCDTALLKGRSNYLCMHRLKQFGAALPSSRQIQSEYQLISEWSTVTQVGDISEVESVSEHSSLWPAVTSTRDNCLGMQCPEHQRCFMLKARKRAQKARIVVVNHHLLFADMRLKEDGFGELLPEADAIIMDEAHQLPDIAGQYFGFGLSSRQITGLIDDVREALLAHPECVERLTELDASLQQSVGWIQNALLANRRNQVQLSLMLQNEQFVAELLNVTDNIGQLSTLFADHVDSNPEFVQLHLRAIRMAEQIAGFCEKDAESIQWFDVYARRFVLRNIPLHISGPFQRLLAEYSASCLYTSATLAAQNGFAHFRAQLGLEDITEVMLSSPYNYKEHALLYLSETLINVADANYVEYVVETCIPMIEANNGNAFLLFTSHNALDAAASMLRKKGKFKLFVQGESSKRELLQGFRESGNSVLLGTQSFWEGVDVKGPDLSLVVIDKLPFASPSDPVVEARSRALEESGENPFMSYQLPQAIVSLKQGVGRLIRHEDDRGVVAILDPRILSRRYGPQIIRHLPPMCQTTDIQQVIEFLRSLRVSHEHSLH